MLASQFEQNQHESALATYRLAGFWIRGFAFLVDLLIVMALTYLLVAPVKAVFGLEGEWALLSVRFSYIGLIGSLYFIVLTKALGQTAGKMLFGLRVVKADGASLDWLTVLFREGVGRFLAQFLFYIGYLWAAFHPQKKAWQDLIADTYVVYDPAEEDRMKIKLNVSA